MIDNFFIIGGVRIDRDSTFEELKETGVFRIEDSPRYPSLHSKIGETLPFYESNCLVEINFWGKRLHDIRLDFWDPEIFGDLIWGTKDYQWKEFSYFLDLMRRHYGEPDDLDGEGFEYYFDGGCVACGLYMDGRDPYTGGYLKIVFH